jgi:hypothetical protein
VLVDDDAEYHRVMAGNDAAVEFGARASIATAWHWVGSPISCTPLSSSILRIEPRL